MVSQYFQALQNRNFSAAEAMLKRFREKVGGEEWGLGYANAMEGLLLSARSNDDRYLYYKRLPSSRELLQESRRKWRRRIGEIDLLGPDFDEGFFACWLDFLRSVEDNLGPASAALHVKGAEQPGKA